MPLKYWD
jgi:hypothetical protein